MGHSADIDTENAVKCGYNVNVVIYRSFSCLSVLGPMHVQQKNRCHSECVHEAPLELRVPHVGSVAALTC